MAKNKCTRIPNKVRKAAKDLATGKNKKIRSEAAVILVEHKNKYH